MTAPDVPRTTAGRALLETCRDTGFDAEGDTAWWRDRILAIEAEAAASGLDVESIAAALWDTSGAGEDVPWIDVPEANRAETREWAAAIFARLAQEEGA